MHHYRHKMVYMYLQIWLGYKQIGSHICLRIQMLSLNHLYCYMNKVLNLRLLRRKYLFQE